jgi:mono/diheme cytochrome c family protein
VTDRLRKRWAYILALGATAAFWWLAPAIGTADEAASPVPSSNPLSGDPDAIEAGRKLYGTWCSQCHGGKAEAAVFVLIGNCADGFGGWAQSPSVGDGVRHACRV